MNGNKTYDTIVVGAGISGILSALALGKEGHKVLVLEKTDTVGGNCRTYEVENTGYFVDTGVHAITTLNSDGPLVQLMNKYFNVMPRFVPHGQYYVRFPGGFVHFPNTLKGFMDFRAIPKSDRNALMKAVLKAITHLARVEKSDISAYDFIKDCGLSDEGMRLVDALSYFSSGLSMKETPAWRILSAGGLLNDGKRKITDKISDFFRLAINKSYSEQGYPKGGIQSILDSALKSLPSSVEIKTCEGVLRISDKHGINEVLREVSTEKSAYFAREVVYSGSASELPKIACAPKEWAASFGHLKKSRALTIWLGLKKPAEALKYMGSEVWFSRGVPYWAMPVSCYDPFLAPKGKMLAGFTTFIGDSDPKKIESLLLETICSAIPEIKGNIEMKHSQILVPEKAAISVGLKFPEVKTPMKNIYIVGTDADMRSMGITRAAYSVLEMLRQKGILKADN